MSPLDDEDASIGRLGRLLRIEAVLDRVRPLLKLDGVDIQVIEVREHGASVRVTGLANMCLIAPLNFHTELEAVLREEIDGFIDLRLLTEQDTPLTGETGADAGAGGAAWSEILNKARRS